MKGYTDFIGGMLMGRELCKRSTTTRYMDWHKAAQICREHPNSTIFAGLMEDWNNTSGMIWQQGEYRYGYVYDQSKWATPILDVDGEEIECWTIEPQQEGHNIPDWWGYPDYFEDNKEPEPDIPWYEKAYEDLQ